MPTYLFKYIYFVLFNYLFIYLALYFYLYLYLYLYVFIYIYMSLGTFLEKNNFSENPFGVIKQKNNPQAFRWGKVSWENRHRLEDITP